MQKIEHIMLDVFVILPAPENPYSLFKNTIYWKVDDIPMIKNIKNWALPEPNELIICMQGDFDMEIHILMVTGP